MRRQADADRPVPDSATEAAVRAALGRRRPPGARLDAVPVDRVDLLAAVLTPETLALVVLWLSGTRRGSVATRRNYADDVLHWARFAIEELGRDRFALDLRRGEVTMWLTREQGAGRSPATIARRIAALSSLYRYAAGWGLPVTSPISDDDHRPRLERGRRATSARVLAADEIAAILAAAEDARDALVVALLYTDALRVSAMCAANADDIEDEGRRCWIRMTVKGGKTIRVPLAPAVVDLYDAYAATRPAWTGDGPAPLIVDGHGRRLDRHDVTRILRRLARAAGIPRPEKVTPHSLRASAITDQIARGRPITEVQELSGHADIRTVLIYVEQHGRDERVTAAATDLSRILADVATRFRA